MASSLPACPRSTASRRFSSAVSGSSPGGSGPSLGSGTHTAVSVCVFTPSAPLVGPRVLSDSASAYSLTAPTKSPLAAVRSATAPMGSATVLKASVGSSPEEKDLPSERLGVREREGAPSLGVQKGPVLPAARHRATADPLPPSVAPGLQIPAPPPLGFTICPCHLKGLPSGESLQVFSYLVVFPRDCEARLDSSPPPNCCGPAFLETRDHSANDHTGPNDSANDHTGPRSLSQQGQRLWQLRQ